MNEWQKAAKIIHCADDTAVVVTYLFAVITAGVMPALVRFS
jgi:hypothetical protein